MTPHSARKVQKMPANGISFELRAHQMARMSEVPGRPRTKNPRRSLMKFWTLQNFTIPPERPPESSRTRAHLPVLSRRLFGVCKRHLDCYFFAWYCTSPFRRFWYWYCDACMKEQRGIGVGATFAGVYFLFFFFFAFYVLALRPRTRPAIEFVSGEEGPRPASSSFSSSIRSWSTWT